MSGGAGRRSVDEDRALHLLGRVGDAGAAEVVGGVGGGRRDDVEPGGLAGGEADLVMHDPAGIALPHTGIFEEAVRGEIVLAGAAVVEAQHVGAALLERDAGGDEAIVRHGDVDRGGLAPVLRRSGGGESEGNKEHRPYITFHGQHSSVWFRCLKASSPT